MRLVKRKYLPLRPQGQSSTPSSVALVFGQQGVAGIAGRQHAEDLDNARLPRLGRRKRKGPAENDVGKGRGVLVARRAIDKHRAHLLDHAVEIENAPRVDPQHGCRTRG